LYRLRAQFCIVLLSANYSKSHWTKLELEAALAREFQQGNDYILPIRLDDSEVDGILPTKGCLEWQDHSPQEIAAMVKLKIMNKGVAS
jgi:hypothetical protein